MPQISAALTINDGSATPVAKTFAPERVAPELSTFTERTTGISAGFARLGVGFSPATAKRATNRTDLSVDVPVLQTVNGVSSVAYVLRFKGYFVTPDTATAAERANLQAYVANAMNHATVKAVVKDNDPMY